MRADRQDDDPALDTGTVAYSVRPSSGVGPGEFSINYLAGDGTLVPSEDVPGLMAALEARIADPARRRAYGAAALDTARAYDAEPIGAQWQALLSALEQPDSG